MCGLIGFTGRFSKDVIHNLKSIMRESSIRGLHASGFAFSLNDGGIKLKTFDEPINRLADHFYDYVELSNPEDGDKFNFIAHARFSTSCIGWNQPIGDEELAIAHNGVITQADSSEWEKLYGYKCTGKNDSELLFHCIKEGSSPMEKFPSASISALILNRRELKYIANGKRPLWSVTTDSGVYFASTRDIFVRAGFDKDSCVKLTSDDLQLRENIL